MKEISKTTAWDIKILNNEKAVYLYEKSIQITDISGKRKSTYIKFSQDTYSHIVVIEKHNILMAMKRNNNVHIYELNTLLPIKKIVWKKEKKCVRENSIVAKDEQKVYSILFLGDVKLGWKSYVTEIDLETSEERILIELPESTPFEIKYCSELDDYLIHIIRYFEKELPFQNVGSYEAIAVKDNNISISFPRTKQYCCTLEKFGIMSNNDILYSTCGRGYGVYNARTDEKILGNVETIAFSEKGEYIAYVERNVEQRFLYIMEYESRKIIDKVEIDHYLIHELEFRGNDKFILLRDSEWMYMYEI